MAEKVEVCTGECQIVQIVRRGARDGQPAAILQQKWQVIEPGAEPRYEWRDVPTIQRNEDESSEGET